jgi:hypothetical protein
VPTTPGPAFFVHVMKTGGATFRQHIEVNVGPGALYPDPVLDAGDGCQAGSFDEQFVANTSVARMLDAVSGRRHEVRAVTGHFPLVAADLLAERLGTPARTLTVLRHPVDRILSYLAQRRRSDPERRAQPLEAVYEDPFQFSVFIRDHQVKQFAMTPDDVPAGDAPAYMEVIEVDDARLARATANLDRVDVVGFQDRYGCFLLDVAERLGWRIGTVDDRHVAGSHDVPTSFRRRIEADNAADMAFYEHAAGRRRPR